MKKSVRNVLEGDSTARAGWVSSVAAESFTVRPLRLIASSWCHYFVTFSKFVNRVPVRRGYALLTLAVTRRRPNTNSF